MTHRTHDLAKLRENIKYNATRAREHRIEARATTHDERYWLKFEANDYGQLTRAPHLAVGYLRGRIISQMESETTHPDNLPSADHILLYAKRAFLRGPDAPSWPTEERTETHKTVPVPDDRGIFARLLGIAAAEPKTEVTVNATELDPPGWDEFKAHVEADLKAWHAHVLANHAMKAARRAAREALPAGGSETRVVA